MSGRKDREKARALARAAWQAYPTRCPRCGANGAHFVPPSLGEPGFYICELLT